MKVTRRLYVVIAGGVPTDTIMVPLAILGRHATLGPMSIIGPDDAPNPHSGHNSVPLRAAILTHTVALALPTNA